MGRTILTKPLQEVEIMEEFGPLKTGGHYCAESFVLDMPEGSGVWHTKDISFPIPISLYCASWIHDESMQYDDAQFSIAPDTIIGAINQPVASGDTRIYVTDTVHKNLAVGYWTELYSASGVWDCGRTTKVEPTYIEVEKPPQQAFSPLWPTYIRQTIMMVPYICMNGTSFVQIGQAKIGGSYIPANTVLRMRYRNISGVAKRFTWIFEYTY